MNVELLQELRLSNFSGGSGRGMSFWQDAAKCGMRAVLREKRQLLYSNDSGKIPAVAQEDLTKKQHFAVGSAYHKLQELWRLDKLPRTQLDFNEPLEDASVAEAVRLFEGYVSFWDKNFWGSTVAVEELIPSTEEARREIARLLGTEVTAKPDLITHVTEADLPRIGERCPAITEPGYYVVDFKTSDTSYPDIYYRGGLQALWYPWAWNVQHPDKQVVGTIFDVIHKFGRRKDKSVTMENFNAVYVPAPDVSELGTLIGLINQGLENIMRAEIGGLGNRAECFQFSFAGVNICPFFGKECTNENSLLQHADGFS